MTQPPDATHKPGGDGDGDDGGGDDKQALAEGSKACAFDE